MSDTSFNYLAAEKTELYRAVMQAFSEAKEQFLVHLRPEDILGRTAQDGRRPDLETIQAALNQLVEWGNLQAEPDTSRVTTVEDFYRARYLYQITREGEAAQAALATFERMLGHQGALQSVALADIANQLRALDTLLGADGTRNAQDPAKAHLLLRDITRVFADLADNARDFMAGLARGLDLRTTERDAFIAYKDRLLGYLRQFIGDLVTRSTEISQLIVAVQASPGFLPLLERIADRGLVDLSPARAAVDRLPEPVGGRRRRAGRWDDAGAEVHHIGVGRIGYDPQRRIDRSIRKVTARVPDQHRAPLGEHGAADKTERQREGAPGPARRPRCSLLLAFRWGPGHRLQRLFEQRGWALLPHHGRGLPDHR